MISNLNQHIASFRVLSTYMAAGFETFESPACKVDLQTQADCACSYTLSSTFYFGIGGEILFD